MSKKNYLKITKEELMEQVVIPLLLTVVNIPLTTLFIYSILHSAENYYYLIITPIWLAVTFYVIRWFHINTDTDLDEP